MNTVALKAPRTVDTNSKVMQEKIYAVIESSRKAIRKLAWIILSTPAYSDQLLRDPILGAEFRRMKL